jgi:hypothetical protein
MKYRRTKSRNNRLPLPAKREQGIALLALLVGLLGGGAAHAEATAEQIFQSVQDNMEHHDDPTKLLAVVACVAGLIILVSLLRLRQQRTVSPKVVNHRGKLTKELAKAIQLKPAEVKQLKTLADSQEVSNPLVLLLCPSLFAKALKDHPEKIDRSVVAGLAKKVTSSR